MKRGISSAILSNHPLEDQHENSRINTRPHDLSSHSCLESYPAYFIDLADTDNVAIFTIACPLNLGELHDRQFTRKLYTSLPHHCIEIYYCIPQVLIRNTSSISFFSITSLRFLPKCLFENEWNAFRFYFWINSDGPMSSPRVNVQILGESQVVEHGET